MKNKNNNETIQKSRTATILFVDLVRSSELASIQTIDDYKKHVQKFQNLVLQIFKDPDNGVGERKNKITDENFIDYSVRGDEGFLIIASKHTDEHTKEDKKIIEKDILDVLKVALRIKYEWLFTKENILRLDSMKQPFEVAIGINTGNVTINKNIEIEDLMNAEGYAINLAKRIETEARKGDSSGIFISEHTFGYYNGIEGENILRFKQQEKSILKGISGYVRTYELIFSNIEEDEEILRIPKYLLKDWENIKDDLSKIEKYFNDTLNPWFGNVVANIKWKKASNLLDELDNKKHTKAKKLEKNKLIERLMREAVEIARKLIEIDPKSSVWKIYLSQILFDYLFYHIVDYNDEIADMKSYRKLLTKDTVEILIALTSDEPHELDGRLYLGKYYLEIQEITDALEEDSSEDKVRKNKYNKMALEQFQRIIIWDDEYPDAYYYQAAALLQPMYTNEGKVIDITEENIEAAKKLLEKSYTFAGKINKTYRGRMEKYFIKDELFKLLW